MNGYVILGGAGGIGKATCELLKEHGHKVTAGVRDPALALGLDRVSGVEYRQVDAEGREECRCLGAESLDSHLRWVAMQLECFTRKPLNEYLQNLSDNLLV